MRRFTWQREIPREPVSTGIFVIEAFGAASLIGFESAALIGSITIAAAATGANYALNRVLTPKVGNQSAGSVAGINTSEARGSVRQSAPPRSYLYGVGRIGGAVSFIDDSKPPLQYLQLLHSDRPLSRILKAFIGAAEITFPTTAHNTIVQPLESETHLYSNPEFATHAEMPGVTSLLRASFRYGTDDQTKDALLVAGFPNLEATFRQQGIATSTWEFRFSRTPESGSQMRYDEVWGRVAIPSPELFCEGCPVYDPRDPAQRYPEDWQDAADVADAMATWEFRRTAALCQADWLGYPDGIAMRPDQIRWDEIADAADYDDEIIEEGLPRHTADGVVTLGDNPNIAMEALLTANRGFCVQSRGRGWVKSSKPQAPRLTITDSMMRGGFEFNEDRPRRGRLNAVGSRFASVERKYQEVEGPERRDQALIDEDGEELRTVIRLPFTSDNRNVQILAEQYKQESRLPRSWSGPISLKGFGLDAGDCVKMSSALFPAMNGLYTVEEVGLREDDNAVNVSLNEYDPDISTAAVELEPFTLPEHDVS